MGPGFASNVRMAGTHELVRPVANARLERRIQLRIHTCNTRPSKAVRPAMPWRAADEGQPAPGIRFCSPLAHLKPGSTEAPNGPDLQAAVFQPLLLGGRLRGFFPRVFGDLVLVVVKAGPLALHRRLQHHTVRGASHAEDRKDRNDDNGQDPHTWPM